MRMKRFGIWQAKPWREVLAEVKRIAGGLLDIGVSRGDLIPIIGNNAPEIYCAMTACQSIGAIAVPVYGVPPNDDYASMLNETNAHIAIVQDLQQVDALLSAKNLKNPLQTIIYTNGRGIDAAYATEPVRSYNSLCEQGDNYLSTHPTFFEDNVNAGKEEDISLIIFNSGVDQPSKPAQLSYKNLLSIARYIVKQDQIDDKDEMLSFMPISLAPNLLCGYVMSHVAGFCLSCPESAETVMEDLREVTPSILYAPPYAYKQIVTSMYERVETTRGLSKWLYNKYIAEPTRSGQNSMSILGDILVASPVRNLYGLGRLKLGFTGGDSIHAATYNFFQALGIKLKQIYGTAETAGCITMQIEERSPHDVGHHIEGVEVKVSDDGEILCKGDNVFCGYYQHESDTNTVIDAEGWYHTGDVGVMNADGVLHVYDKLSARIKFKDGSVCLPKLIENSIKASPYVQEAFVTDVAGETLFAAVCIDRSTVGRWAEHNGIRYTSYADLAQQEAIQTLITEAVHSANQQTTESQNTGQPRQPMVKQFSIMHRTFSPQSGELTWTNKLRRNFLREYLSPSIQAISDGQKHFQISDESVDLKILEC